MQTRTVKLTDRLNAYIEAVVASGRYVDADDVIREGLRLLALRQSAPRSVAKPPDAVPRRFEIGHEARLAEQQPRVFAPGDAVRTQFVITKPGCGRSQPLRALLR